MKFRNISIVAVIILVILGFAFFGGNKNKNQDENKPIKIGAAYSLTGVASSWAELGKNAAEMAIQEINSNGGVNGRKIEIIYEDAQTNPTRSVAAFRKLVDIDKVDVVIGDMWAFLTNPLIPLAEQNKILTISPTVMDVSVEGKSDFFFTLGHMVESIKPAIRKFFSLHPSVKTVGIICSNDPWGYAISRAYEDIVLEFNKTIVEKTCTTGFDADYRTEAAKIKAANPDAVMIMGLDDRAVKMLKNQGVNAPILSDSNIVDGFENRDLPLSYLNNVFAIDWHADEDFINKYQEKYGRYPIAEAQNSYEVIRSIAKAFESDPENPVNGLKQVKYQSVDGFIDFTQGNNHNPNKAEARLFKILGKGKYEVL